MDSLLEEVTILSPNLKIRELECENNLPPAKYLDFRCFLVEPKIPFDCVVSNEKIGFPCHKNILRKISSVFDDLLTGDESTKILPLCDLSNSTLITLQKLIYGNPKKRNKIFNNTKNHDFISILLLASKYNILFMQQILSTYFSSKRNFSLIVVGELLEEMKAQNLECIANIMVDSEINQQVLDKPQPLTGLPTHLVEMIATSLLPRKNSREWVIHLIDYVSNSKNHDVQTLKTILLQKIQNPNFLPADELRKIMSQILKSTIWSNKESNVQLKKIENFDDAENKNTTNEFEKNIQQIKSLNTDDEKKENFANNSKKSKTSKQEDYSQYSEFPYSQRGFSPIGGFGSARRTKPPTSPRPHSHSSRRSASFQQPQIQNSTCQQPAPSSPYARQRRPPWAQQGLGGSQRRRRRSQQQQQQQNQNDYLPSQQRWRHSPPNDHYLPPQRRYSSSRRHRRPSSPENQKHRQLRYSSSPEIRRRKSSTRPYPLHTRDLNRPTSGRRSRKENEQIHHHRFGGNSRKHSQSRSPESLRFRDSNRSWRRKYDKKT